MGENFRNDAIPWFRSNLSFLTHIAAKRVVFVKKGLFFVKNIHKRAVEKVENEAIARGGF